MQKSNAPTKLTIVFASGTGAGPVNAVPLAPGATVGTASYQTGFTSVNMEPTASGGIPPFGADFNGLFQDATKARIWQQAGYMYPFDATFAGNSNIGGYPAGSVLMMSSGKGLWLNQSDNNSANPDTTGASGWIGIAAAGTSTINTTGGTVTPDPSVLGVTTLLIAGTLTANASVVLPLTAGRKWIVVNNTTGSFTVTVQGVTGTGMQVAQGTSNAAYVFTDGTNFYATSANVSGLYLPINGNAVSASKLANARTIGMTGDVAWGVSFDGSANVTANGTIQAGAVSLAKMANLTANTLLGNPTSSAATPQAITLANGLQFSGTTLGMGAITPSSITTAGRINCPNILAYSYASSYANQGGYLAWNQSAANGEMDFINNHGGGIGGWTWYDTSGGGTGLSAIMTLSAAGALQVGSVATNSIIPQATQGLQFVWNTATVGQGRNEYINNYGGGTGGHYFYVRSLTTGGLTSVATLDSSGNFSVGASGTFGAGITVSQNFASSTVNFVCGTNGAGTFYFRPNGIGSTAGQATLDSGGNFTATTGNFTSSDENLKEGIVPIEPQPFHRDERALTTYAWRDGRGAGRGPIAQVIHGFVPAYTHVYDEDGHLAVDVGRAAYEQGIWCGRQIDALLNRVAALEERS